MGCNFSPGLTNYLEDLQANCLTRPCARAEWKVGTYPMLTTRLALSQLKERAGTQLATAMDSNTLQVATTTTKINVVASLRPEDGDLPVTELRALTARTIRDAGTAAKQLATILQF